MSDEIVKKLITLEDGRRAEKIVQQASENDCEGKTITELWVEPPVQKKLSKRVVEHKKPIIHRREIETIDEETGEIIKREVESLEPDVKMQLREVIQTESSVRAQSFEEPKDCCLTKEEIQDVVVQGISTLVNSLKENNTGNVGKVSAMQYVVGEKQSESDSLDGVSTVLWGAITCLSAVLVYIVFFY